MATPRGFARFLARARMTSPRVSSITASSSRSYSSNSPRIIPQSSASPAAAPTPRSHWVSLRTYQPSLAPSARTFSSSAAARHGHVDPPKPGEELWVTFIDKDGQEIKVAVNKGDNLLDIAQAHDVEMEGKLPPAAHAPIPELWLTLMVLGQAHVVAPARARRVMSSCGTRTITTGYPSRTTMRTTCWTSRSA